MTPLLVVDRVAKCYGLRPILRGVSFGVDRGEFVAVLGKSGCGKTTLLRVLADLDHGAEGEVEVPLRVGVAFQDARLLPWKRVARNVALGLHGDDVDARVHEALTEVGMDALARAWPATLSGGETARVALARALVRRPELLLLDEPFGSLDALTRLRMQDLLRTLCDRYRPSVLMVTHDVDEAIVLADRVVVLADGVIVHERVPGLEHPRDRASAAFLALRGELLGRLGVRGNSSTEAPPAD